MSKGDAEQLEFIDKRAFADYDKTGGERIKEKKNKDEEIERGDSDGRKRHHADPLPA